MGLPSKEGKQAAKAARAGTPAQEQRRGPPAKTADSADHEQIGLAL